MLPLKNELFANLLRRAQGSKGSTSPRVGSCPHPEKASRARRLDLASAFRYEIGMETLLEDGIDGQPPATTEKRFPISISPNE